MAYLRTVKTSSGATAVQIVYSNRRGARDIEHLGSAHTAAEVEALKAAGRQRMRAGQGELNLDLGAAARDAGAAGAAGGGPLPITAMRMGPLWQALERGYQVLGFPAAAGAEQVFKALVLARIIEPSSKLDAARVLEEAGSAPRRTRRSSAAYRCSRRSSSGPSWPRRAPRIPG